jgi:hypothetical protein
MEKPLHAFFVSYRHPASKKGIEELWANRTLETIRFHLETSTHNYDIYFDEERLLPTYQYNQQLAKHICRSACMVVLYWPSYLESDYCLKEINTMLSIEKRRRKILGPALHGHRLFLPIIFRGAFEQLPSSLSDCQYLDVRDHSNDPNFSIGEDFKIKTILFDISESIKHLCDVMSAASDQLFNNCDSFVFPRFRGTPQTVRNVPIVQPFPGRR